MFRLALLAPFLLAALGCGTNPQQAKEDFERNAKAGEAALEKRLKEIAGDPAASDADAVKKYLDALPSVQTNLPAGVAPGWAANSKSGVWHVTLHAMLQSQAEGSTPDQRMQSERAFIRGQMIGCKRILEHLKGRKVEGVSLQVYTKLSGEEKPTELFRAVMTTADLPKFEKLPELADPAVTSAVGTAAEGAVYDPRGPKIGDCWTVELNRYPELEYKKKQ
jgi:hypothetical protein